MREKVPLQHGRLHGPDNHDDAATRLILQQLNNSIPVIPSKDGIRNEFDRMPDREAVSQCHSEPSGEESRFLTSCHDSILHGVYP